MDLIATLSINDTIMTLDIRTDWHYAQCLFFLIVILMIIMLNVVMLIVVAPLNMAIYES